ncbi:class IIb bacteriocin, lactobin A/cerein 7B family [Streptococcus vestibularis]|jgi:lactobin A/cerein 7B family class IIb bacteriocin|uniref:Class IIb bacteriocin, lactobin A/cerein 7B family n=2 Tax=Streptococcus vestibularis TaxID=1343 RepID=E3CN59_STRVE|nr:class IIb bacteriocin, lactobin A/cerein 7B family [Streptococcus vestibularis]EFQ60309.1 class IIb bacteriocin, lactobin A/cerein 7B family [Streptococcus vestibularis F0396]MDU4284666.1 class IIb bacteriocin, lactobin A/cerein 7B family [Streptococcus sp.]EFX96947.1 class IIb bacteriocin, lactobin A/cerein 7B family [Streptococcus vestibularis ATCC 49124]MBT3133034.1 class IIb bacteriocin, lactobin A/cerein 7B family [Streptococcus vestibularis]MCB8556471.1 class IIb bacteriocin, lactobin
MTTQELEIVSGGTVPWVAISVGIVGSKLTYDLSYAAGKSFYNHAH